MDMWTCLYTISHLKESRQDSVSKNQRLTVGWMLDDEVAELNGFKEFTNALSNLSYSGLYKAMACRS